MIGTSPLGLTRTIGVPEVDAIVPRIGASVTFYGLAVVRQFETLGVITTATADAIACSRDKLRSLQTMDNYPILYRCLFGQPGIRQLRDMVLKFCGIKPVKVTLFGSVKFASPEKRTRWLGKAKAIGRKDGK